MQRYRYVGLWDGGPSYSGGYWTTDAECFTSVAHAARVLVQRNWGGWVNGPDVPRVAEWVYSETDFADFARPGNRADNLRCPAVEDSSILLASIDTRLSALEQNGPYVCTHLLTIGPRGGARVKRL